MPRHTRPRREPTDDYQQLSLWAKGPEHCAFELVRPVVLFGQSPAARARETGAAAHSAKSSVTPLCHPTWHGFAVDAVVVTGELVASRPFCVPAATAQRRHRSYGLV
jgi:hypothetical protein